MVIKIEDFPGNVIPSLSEVNVLSTLTNSRSTSRMVLRWLV